MHRDYPARPSGRSRFAGHESRQNHAPALTAIVAFGVGAPMIGGTTGLMVPAAWPLVGGILIRDTVPCVVVGGLTLLAAHFVGAQVGGEYGNRLREYGKMIGGMLVVMGPVLDILGG